MDKLKENGFAIGLAGLGVLLLSLGYVLVFAPIWGTDGLLAQKKKLNRSNITLNKHLRKDVLPTTDYNRRVRDKAQADRKTFKDTIEGFEQRCKLFDTFFDSTNRVPNFADFSASYNDEVGKLRKSYWAKFPGILAAIDPNDRTDTEKLAPEVEVVEEEQLREESSTMIPFAMKQYWVAEAIFKACEELGISGLKKIDILEPRDERKRSGRESGSSRSRSKKKAEDAPKYVLVYHRVQATVTVHMRYGQFEDFLAKLLDRNGRVPFIEPASVKMSKLSGEEPVFTEYVQKVEYPTAARAQAAEAAGEPKIEEPVAEFVLKLVAIDWDEVKRSADETPDEDTKDDI